jgi:hypothetical protein
MYFVSTGCRVIVNTAIGIVLITTYAIGAFVDAG